MQKLPINSFTFVLKWKLWLPWSACRIVIRHLIIRGKHINVLISIMILTIGIVKLILNAKCTISYFLLYKISLIFEINFTILKSFNHFLIDWNVLLCLTWTLSIPNDWVRFFVGFQSRFRIFSFKWRLSDQTFVDLFELIRSFYCRFFFKVLLYLLL